MEVNQKVLLDLGFSTYDANSGTPGFEFSNIGMLVSLCSSQLSSLRSSLCSLLRTNLDTVLASLILEVLQITTFVDVVILQPKNLCCGRVHQDSSA